MAFALGRASHVLISFCIPIVTCFLIESFQIQFLNYRTELSICIQQAPLRNETFWEQGTFCIHPQLQDLFYSPTVYTKTAGIYIPSLSHNFSWFPAGMPLTLIGNSILNVEL